MAALLKKFRIKFESIIVLSELNKKASEAKWAFCRLWVKNKLKAKTLLLLLNCIAEKLNFWKNPLHLKALRLSKFLFINKSILLYEKFIEKCRLKPEENEEQYPWKITDRLIEQNQKKVIFIFFTILFNTAIFKIRWYSISTEKRLENFTDVSKFYRSLIAETNFKNFSIFFFIKIKIDHYINLKELLLQYSTESSLIVV